MEGEGPVLGDENKAVEGELAPRNGTQGSAQREAGMLGSPAPKAPQRPGPSCGGRNLGTELWVRTAGRRLALPAQCAGSQSLFTTDGLTELRRKQGGSPSCVGDCRLPTGSPPPHGDSEALLTRRKTCSAPREKRQAGGSAKGQNTGFLKKGSRQQLS